MAWWVFFLNKIVKQFTRQTIIDVHTKKKKTEKNMMYNNKRHPLNYKIMTCIYIYETCIPRTL